MKKNICPNCAGKIQPGSTICKNCGYTLEQKESVRPYEERYQEEETFEQGRSLDSDKKRPFVNYGIVRGPYCKWISIPLCLLLGWLGGHKFYEGKYFMGILYAFTFGFFGIGILLDLIQLFQKKKYYYVSSIPFVM